MSTPHNCNYCSDCIAVGGRLLNSNHWHAHSYSVNACIPGRDPCAESAESAWQVHSALSTQDPAACICYGPPLPRAVCAHLDTIHSHRNIACQLQSMQQATLHVCEPAGPPQPAWYQVCVYEKESWYNQGRVSTQPYSGAGLQKATMHYMSSTTWFASKSNKQVGECDSPVGVQLGGAPSGTNPNTCAFNGRPAKQTSRPTHQHSLGTTKPAQSKQVGPFLMCGRHQARWLWPGTRWAMSMQRNMGAWIHKQKTDTSLLQPDTEGPLLQKQQTAASIPAW
jgi:hypothetical protein